MFGKYPSLFLLIFIVPSIAAASECVLPAWLLLGLAAAGTVVGIWWLRRDKNVAASICFGMAVGILAGAHFSARYSPGGPSHISHVITTAERAQIFGVVDDWPEIRGDVTELIVDLDSLGDLDGITRPVIGRILIKVTDTSTALQRGDRIEFFGRLYPLKWQRADDHQDYRRRLRMQEVFATVYLPTLLDVRIDKRLPWTVAGVADRLHDAMVSVIKSDLPSETASLAAGFLIGETRDIPVDTYRHFRDSGTLHVLAVSGGNVALVCLYVILILRPFGAVGKTRSMILLPVVVFFALVCYAEPSVVRASVMAALVLTARMLQRKVDLHNIIALTAVVVLLYDPAQLFDVGAQLSFASAWGLILFMPHIASRFEPVQHRWWYRFLLFPILVSIVAQVCSTPLIAYYFGDIPLLSIVANLVVVPLAAVATLGTLAMLTAHLLLPLLGAFVGSLLHPVLVLLLMFVNLFGESSAPQIHLANHFPGSWTGTAIVGSYFVIALFAWSLSYRRARRFCVLTVVALTNLSLVKMAVVSVSADGTQCFAASVPGGVAVLLTNRDQPADMIITGLADRPYEVDTRILVPFVSNCGIDRVSRLFVLSADFGALDDLFRFADAAQVETLLVEARAGGAVREVRSRFVAAKTMTIREFGGQLNAGNEVITADNRGVRYSSGGEDILISRFQPDTSNGQSIPSTWIYGRTWRPSPDDWLIYDRLGIRRIVCAKIQQALPDDEAFRAIDVVLPPQIVDLSSVSQVSWSTGR